MASSAATELYRAQQPGLDRRVLVRKLRRDLLVRPGLADAFRREARLAARVRHPNVSGVIDLFAHGGDHYLVLEDADGPSLREALERHGRPPRRAALAIVRALARALDALHAAGLVHADMRPEHVSLGRWGVIQLRDWSAARSVDETDAPAAPVNPYSAPEVVAGAGCGPPADVYAWATLAAELVTGVPPGDRPAPLLRMDPRLALLLRACLDRDPARRPRAADVCARVERLVALADSRAGTEVLGWLSAARPAASGDARTAEAGGTTAMPAVLAAPAPPAASALRAAPAGAWSSWVPALRLPALPRASLRPMAAGIAAGALVVGALELASQHAAGPAPAPDRYAELRLEPAAVDAGLAPPEPSYLRVSAFPWAEVHVNGVSTFTTPRAAPLELPPGRHRVVLEHPRFGRVERTIRLASGQHRTVRHVFDLTQVLTQVPGT